jgi:hypothetical protein
VHAPPFDGAGVPTLAYTCSAWSCRWLGIELAPSAQEILGGYGLTPNSGARTESAFLHELVAFAPPLHLRRWISTSSHGFVLRRGLNNWRHISEDLDMQEIGKRSSRSGRGSCRRSTRKSDVCARGSRGESSRVVAMHGLSLAPRFDGKPRDLCPPTTVDEFRVEDREGVGGSLEGRRCEAVRRSHCPLRSPREGSGYPLLTAGMAV